MTKTRYTFNNLFFEATRQCNFSCGMCMARSNDKKLVRALSGRELTTEEIEHRVLASVKEIGVETITWSGGEFILRRDAVELVRLASRYGYASIIATNGSRMDREKLFALNEASQGTLVVAVGINSIQNENSWTRDTDCESAVRVLDLCAELGIRRNVVVTIGQHNLRTLHSTLEWLEQRGIPYNRSPFTARGSGRDYWDRLHFTAEQMESVIHPALRKHALGYISYTPFFLAPEVHEKYSKGRRNVTVPQNPSIGCWCGTWLGVSAEGDVSPCGILLDDVSCGNVREKTFQEIIDSSPVFQRILDRNQLQGKCGRCRYKFTCGGCRAMAYYEHGDIMAEDPTCFFEPVDETTVCEHEEETNRMFRRYAFMVRNAHAKRRLLTAADAADPLENESENDSGDPFPQAGRA
ncbi:MAG: radical SAM protein [Acidobacteriota bacterium]